MSCRGKISPFFSSWTPCLKRPLSIPYCFELFFSLSCLIPLFLANFLFFFFQSTFFSINDSGPKIIGPSVNATLDVLPEFLPPGNRPPRCTYRTRRMNGAIHLPYHFSDSRHFFFRIGGILDALFERRAYTFIPSSSSLPG